MVRRPSRGSTGTWRPDSARSSPRSSSSTSPAATVRACHFPYHGDSRDEQRFDHHRPIDDGGVLLHGHVHTRWRVEGRQINLGCDVWDYRPVAEDELEPVVTQLVP